LRKKKKQKATCDFRKVAFHSIKWLFILF
jgi:hypothetical protein